MRVCILTKGEPYGWTRHYIAAFREAGHEVLVAGPNITQDELDAFHLNHLDAAACRTDIECELGPTVRLADFLPKNWLPDLIVAISMAGTPLCPLFDGLVCPRVYLSIDTWQSPRDYVDALQYDYVLAAQKSFVARLQSMGARNVAWLPLAANPSAHFPVRAPQRADVSFAGTIALPIHQERHALLQLLRREFTFIGKSAVFGPGLCALCCSAKLTFNHSAVLDVNMRIFEALAMGCALLTNESSSENGLLDIFQDGEHLVLFHDAEDLVARTKKYLADDTARRRVAYYGRREVMARHTYKHRAEAIVQQACAQGLCTPSAQMPRDPFLEAIPAGAGTLFAMGIDANRGWIPGRAPLNVVRELSIPADVAVVKNETPSALRETLGKLAQTQTDGSTLVLELPPALLAAFDVALDPSSIQRWLTPFGYVSQRLTLHDHHAERILLISARKRSATLQKVIDDAFAVLPSNCGNVHDSVLQWARTNARDL